MGQSSLGNKKIRKYIGPKSTDQLFFTDIFKTVLGVLLGSVVDYNIHPAKRRDGLGDQMLDCSRFAAIARFGR